MALSDLTDPSAVLQAIDQFDALGRDAFLQRYGFGPRVASTSATRASFTTARRSSGRRTAFNIRMRARYARSTSAAAKRRCGASSRTWASLSM
jgi:hypothetical protein